MRFCFGHLELDIPEGVYHPAEDSELLAEALLMERLEGSKVLDIGCGSGFLAILAAKRGARVTAVDIDRAAVVATLDNAIKCGVSLKAEISDLFEAVGQEKFDVIVFNPPYLPEDMPRYADRRWSGGATGRETIGRFIDGAGRHLNESGTVLLLASSLSEIGKVMERFCRNSFRAEIVSRKKIPWEELAVIKATILRR